jgi:hypothetical protein
MPLDPWVNRLKASKLGGDIGVSDCGDWPLVG